ncbi:cellulase family glycosylhydrolase [Bosea sp. 685]|uniref:cellulase family glycosylhydrolase n=1 Tax=Bosea sp. 685 TaxID=3080057 RepID=UPI002893270E|nr:cellulase family glycosylhydrolase [Bosea sp. 685]WNJ88572.1 cellulase family glycosylhydrolase [Bosea sp. 685]
MKLILRNLEMAILGLGFLGLAWGKNKLHGYATPNGTAKSDVAGQIDYLIDIFGSFRRFMPPQFDLRDRDVLELSPGGSRGNGVLFLALGARSYHAIDIFPLAESENVAFYEKLLERFPEGGKADRERALAIASTPGAREFGYAVGRDFDIPRLAEGRRFDLIVSCAAFEHYDSPATAIAGLTQVARPGCETVHIIDLQTHSRWIREQDPNNIYRYPEAIYRLFRFPGQPNRQRPSDYVGSFKAEGWSDVSFVPSRTVDPALRDASLRGLSARFAGQADMTVLDGALRAGYPERGGDRKKRLVTTRRAVLGGLAGIATLASFGRKQAANGQGTDIPLFRRGIGVSHALGWADVEADGSYGAAPFSAPRFSFDQAQRLAIRAAGFDFVRLAVDAGPYLAFVGAARDQLDERLIGIVGDLLDADLGVIVDLHPSAMNPAYRPAALTAGVDTPNFQAVLALQQRLAARLWQLVQGRAGAPKLAFELMNEPEVPQETWQPMLEASYRAARSGSAQLPLVLGGGSMNSPWALPAIDMRPFAGDARLIYTYHDYSPWQFTHQGVRGSPAYALDEIAYPAPPSADAMIAATRRRMTALGLEGAELALAREAKRTLPGYAGFDRSALERNFQVVSAWRIAQNLPAHAVLMGEFGVHKTPYQATPEGAAARETWLRDMRELAEAQGFAWACWTYVATGGFALAEDEIGPGFDAATRRALGLPPL